MKQIVAVCVCLAVAVAAVSANDVPEAESKEERLIGAIITSTTTLGRIVSTTITQPLTCLTGPPSTAPCTGRRKRRHAFRQKMNPSELLRKENAEPAIIDSSLSAANDDIARDGKILFATRLITSFSAFTSTYTSVDSSTTVSVSVLCTFNNIMFSRLC